MIWIIIGLLAVIVLQLWNINILLREQLGIAIRASDMNHENHARLFGPVEAGFNDMRSIWRDLRER